MDGVVKKILTKSYVRSELKKCIVVICINCY